MTKTKPVVVTIGDTDFEFSPTVNDFNNYVNEMMPDNKVAPQHTYLTRTIKPEQKEQLVELLSSVPGLVTDVFSEVSKGAKGGIKVTLKN